MNKQIGGAALDLKTCPSKPFSWILDMVWLNLVELSKLQQFNNIITQVSLSSMDHTSESSIKCAYQVLLVTHFLGVSKWETLESMAQS